MAIYPFEQLDARAAEHRNFVERAGVVGLDDIVKVVAIARESDAEVTSGRRRDNLRVVGGADLSEPEALLSRVAQDVDEVFTVGRDGRSCSFAVIGQARDVPCLKR